MHCGQCCVQAVGSSGDSASPTTSSSSTLITMRPRASTPRPTIDLEAFRPGPFRDTMARTRTHPHPANSSSSVQCGVPGCGADLERSEIEKHLREVHHQRDRTCKSDSTKRARCQWAGCGKKYRWGCLMRHYRSEHLGKQFRCECGKSFKRQDLLRKHQTRSSVSSFLSHSFPFKR